MSDSKRATHTDGGNAGQLATMNGNAKYSNAKRSHIHQRNTALRPHTDNQRAHIQIAYKQSTSHRCTPTRHTLEHHQQAPRNATTHQLSTNGTAPFKQ